MEQRDQKQHQEMQFYFSVDVKLKVKSNKKTDHPICKSLSVDLAIVRSEQRKHEVHFFLNHESQEIILINEPNHLQQVKPKTKRKAKREQKQSNSKTLKERSFSHLEPG